MTEYANVYGITLKDVRDHEARQRVREMLTAQWCGLCFVGWSLDNVEEPCDSGFPHHWVGPS